MNGPSQSPHFNPESVEALIRNDLQELFNTKVAPWEHAVCRKLIGDFYMIACHSLERLHYAQEGNTTPVPAGYSAYSVVLPEGSVEIRRQYYQTGANGMKYEHYISVSSGQSVNLELIKSEQLVPYLFTTVELSKKFQELSGPKREDA